MGVLTGTVVAGKVVVDAGSLVDGTNGYAITRKADGEVRLSHDELAELEAGIAQADRGELITEDALFARLRKCG